MKMLLWLFFITPYLLSLAPQKQIRQVAKVRLDLFLPLHTSRQQCIRRFHEVVSQYVSRNSFIFKAHEPRNCFFTSLKIYHRMFVILSFSSNQDEFFFAWLHQGVHDDGRFRLQFYQRKLKKDTPYLQSFPVILRRWYPSVDIFIESLGLFLFDRTTYLYRSPSRIPNCYRFTRAISEIYETKSSIIPIRRLHLTQDIPITSASDVQHILEQHCFLTQRKTQNLYSHLHTST